MGRFCHVCGQENIVPKESFGKLVLHFFYDITHFDGKFFESVKDLLFRPGFLSKEYIKGRRTSYLNPVRMYVFTSAIFFLIFFMMVNPKDWKGNDDEVFNKKQRLSLISGLEKDYKKPKADSSTILKKIAVLKDTSNPVSLSMLNKLELEDSTSKSPKTFAQYIAAQDTLPPSKRAGWFKRMVVRKFIYNKEFQNNPSGTLQHWLRNFLS